jgi:hypothetical protein
MTRMKAHHLELLENFDRLSPSAVLPYPVVAAHRGLSVRTVRRIYRRVRVKVSDGRVGVRKADLDRPLEVRRRGRPRKRAVVR